MAYFETQTIKNSSGEIINPATEDSIVFLRRIAKILENQQAVDPQQRQRITIDAIASVTLPTVTTVSSVTNIVGLFSWNQQILADPARTAYNTGIRNQLTFS
jgi:hypothetical protein